MRAGRPPVALVAALLLATGCAPPGGDSGPPGPESGASSAPDDTAELVAPGHGTLRQDEVTLQLRHGDLLIKVTPLAEWVIRLTAPDTYKRLAGLRRSHGPALARQSGVENPDLFLVSFFSYQQNIPFQPEDVHLVNRGLRLRPRAIRPVTPAWGVQRLSQEDTEMAVYAYGPGIDLEQEMAVEYRDSRRGGWDRILQTLQAERARVRARARSDTAFRP